MIYGVPPKSISYGYVTIYSFMQYTLIAYYISSTMTRTVNIRSLPSKNLLFHRKDKQLKRQLQYTKINATVEGGGQWIQMKDRG